MSKIHNSAICVAFLTSAACLFASDAPTQPGKSTAPELAVKSSTATLKNTTNKPIFMYGYAGKESKMPFHSFQVKKAGVWTNRQLGWCGTGASRFEVKPGETITFKIHGGQFKDATAYKLTVNYQTEPKGTKYEMVKSAAVVIE